jgi:hypothetical protein
MRGPKPKYPIELTTEEEQALRKLANAHKASHVKVSGKAAAVALPQLAAHSGSASLSRTRGGGAAALRTSERTATRRDLS